MDVSVIIPARNEEFLQPTVDSILDAAEAETEVIAILDGYLSDPPIRPRKNLILIHHPEPIGQRAGVNEGARISKAKYILKTDGHSMLDKGFDVKLMADCEYEDTVLPTMYNHDAFHLVCPECQHEHHQGPPRFDCENCKKTFAEPLARKMVWEPKWRKHTEYMYIDNTLRVQYWSAYKNRKLPDGSKHRNLKIDEVMNGQGACWFQHRDRFWELGGMDEKHGSWGQVGVEVACKAWLSGGRHIVNKNTWFSHLFRTNNKGFSFPYDISGRQVAKARQYSRDLWLKNKWPMQKRKFEWLLDKFKPVPTWHDNV